MKIVYDKIKERIESEVPEILFIELHNNQLNDLSHENVFPFPAIFIDLASNGIFYKSGNAGVKYAETTITIHLVFETYNNNPLDIFPLRDKVFKAIQGFSYLNTFASLDLVEERLDKNYTNLFVMEMDFSTTYKDMASSYLNDLIEVTLDLTLEGSINGTNF